MELKKEAEFFGDVVIVPYMDNYDLVVLKTVAICEYGVSCGLPINVNIGSPRLTLSQKNNCFLYLCLLQVHVAFAKHIMKCDDDTFVRVDAVIQEVNKIPENMSLYVGNINYYHKPLRNGKWAVTYEVIVWIFFLFSCSNFYMVLEG